MTCVESCHLNMCNYSVRVLLKGLFLDSVLRDYIVPLAVHSGAALLTIWSYEKLYSEVSDGILNAIDCHICNNKENKARVENNCNHPLGTLCGWVQGCAVLLSMWCTKQDTLFRTERRGALPPSDSLTFSKWVEQETASRGRSGARERPFI